MKKGIKKLPLIMKDKEYISLLEKTNFVSTKLAKLDVELKNSPISKNLIQLLSFNESVQSTKIEGTQVTFYEIMEVKDSKNISFQQKEILNYKRAIDYGYNNIKNDNMPITTRLMKELHQILMQNARGTSSNAGNFRKIQNFIGEDSNIKNAVYIPIDANEIGEYMTNLEYFINGEDHPSFNVENDESETLVSYDALPLLKIAIAHAQFESIHPFLDGNGRLGRILIVLMAVRYQIFSHPLFFVSEELEKEKIRYYNVLNNTRGESPDWVSWLKFFLEACESMCDKLLVKIESISRYYSEKLKVCNSNSERKILFLTIYNPICTASELSKDTKLHPSTIRNTLRKLSEYGILEKDNSTKRNIKYYNYDVLKIMSS